MPDEPETEEERRRRIIIITGGEAIARFFRRMWDWILRR